MMHEYSCTDVRDRLEAFHDGELTINERIALQDHLGECGPCSFASHEFDWHETKWSCTSLRYFQFTNAGA